MPLAHILAPQIARKTAEIEQALNPQMAGYLQANPNVGTGATRSAKPPQEYNPNTDGGALIQTRGALSRVSPSAARGFDRGAGLGINPETGNLGQSGRAYLIPNAQNGMPMQAPGFAMQPGVVVLPAGAVGMTESGRSVDKRGKKLGYLGGDPNMQMRLADPMNPTQTGGAKMLEKQGGGDAVIIQRYRPHLEAMQANRDESGMPTDKLPAGYFEALGRERGKPFSKDEKKDIMNGIEALRRIDKGVSI